MRHIKWMWLVCSFLLLQPMDGNGVCITDADGGNGNFRNINTRDCLFSTLSASNIVVTGFFPLSHRCVERTEYFKLFT